MESYKLSYFDCTKPKTISRINQKTACSTMTNEKGLSQNYKLLQRRREERVGGFRCKMEVSDFLLYCGSFSHQKLITVPSVDIHENVSGEHCREMANTLRFSPPGSNHVERLQLGAETVIKVSPLGVIKYDSNVHCQGQSAKIGNEVVEQVLELKQYKITLTPENFVIRKEVVEALSTHTRLPIGCTPSAQSCETGEGTYIWDPVLDPCDLNHIQDVLLVKENELYVDHNRKLVFQIEEEIVEPIGCPKGKLFLTKYHDLYLTKTEGYKPMSTRDVDLALYADTRMEYLEYNLERGNAMSRDSVKRQMCENQYGDKQGRIRQLKNETFSVRSGDVFLIFQCSRKTAKIATPAGGSCWDKIRTEDGMFVDVVTRIGYKHASPRDCSVHFPMWVETEGEGWITVSDTIRPVDPPESRYLSTTVLEHESFAGKGLYTEEELESWEAIASWGSFHDSVMSRISTGVCQTEKGPCTTGGSVGVTGYSLEKLSAITNKLDPLSPLTNWVTEHAGYLSLMVLVIYGLQVFYSITIMLLTYSQAGVEAGLSTLYIFLCPGPHAMMRARNRAIRSKRKDDAILDVEMEQLTCKENVTPPKDDRIPPEYENTQ